MIGNTQFPALSDDVITVRVSVQDSAIVNTDKLIIKVRSLEIVINIIDDILCRFGNGILVLVQLCFHNFVSFMFGTAKFGSFEEISNSKQYVL